MYEPDNAINKERVKYFAVMTHSVNNLPEFPDLERI